MPIKTVIEDRVLLKDVKAPEKETNIVILEYFENIKHAEVAFVGESVKNMQPGDKIVFLMPCGYELEFEGVKYQVVRSSDIWFVMK